MCCKCPPFTPTATYVFLSILISSYYWYKASGVDNDSGLISIKSCYASATEESESFLINLALKRVNGSTQAFAGNVSMAFDIDGNVRVTVQGFPNNKQQTLIKNRQLCNIIKNYLTEEEICPIPSGFHKIGPLLLDLPYKMWPCKKFRLEISTDDRILACKILRFENLHLNNV